MLDMQAPDRAKASRRSCQFPCPEMVVGRHRQVPEIDAHRHVRMQEFGAMFDPCFDSTPALRVEQLSECYPGTVCKNGR
jgi:hypothetical protein